MRGRLLPLGGQALLCPDFRNVGGAYAGNDCFVDHRVVLVFGAEVGIRVKGNNIHLRAFRCPEAVAAFQVLFPVEAGEHISILWINEKQLSRVERNVPKGGDALTHAANNQPNPDRRVRVHGLVNIFRKVQMVEARLTVFPRCQQQRIRAAINVLQAPFGFNRPTQQERRFFAFLLDDHQQRVIRAGYPLVFVGGDGVVVFEQWRFTTQPALPAVLVEKISIAGREVKGSGADNGMQARDGVGLAGRLPAHKAVDGAVAPLNGTKRRILQGFSHVKRKGNKS